MEFPQAYHITWSTYGTRLTGSEQQHVTLQQNEYGTPFPEPNAIAEKGARGSMAQTPVILTVEQRKAIEAALQETASRFQWNIHAIAIQSDHCHVVITAMREGQALRDALKAAASRALNPVYGKRTWWAEKGSARYLWEKSYFENATQYVHDQRDF